jgi:hypothetical protein
MLKFAYERLAETPLGPGDYAGQIGGGASGVVTPQGSSGG